MVRKCLPPRIADSGALAALGMIGWALMVMLTWLGAPTRLTAQVAGPNVTSAPSATSATSATSWMLGPTLPDDLEERIEGQTGDLPWERDASTRADRRSLAPLERALRLRGDRETVRVVVFVDVMEDALRISIVDVPERRVLQRDVASAGDRSAELETTAIIIRAALQTLAEGGEIGVRAPPVAPSRPAAPPSPAPVETSPELEPEAQAPTARPTASTAVYLGAAIAVEPIVRDVFTVGAGIDGVLMHRHLMLALDGRLGIPRELREGGVVARVEVLQVRARVGIRLPFGAALDLAPYAALGLGRLGRTTVETPSGTAPTRREATLSPVSGAGLFLRRRLAGNAHLLFDAGIEVPFWRVAFDVSTPTGTRRVGITPRVAPVVRIGILARLGG